MNKNVDLMSSKPDVFDYCTDLPIRDIYDSLTTKYTSKWTQYFDIYERYFHKFKNKSPVVLEIGVDNGGSMEMWKYYFGKDARVYGFDIRPKVHFEDMIIFQGDQGSPDDLDYVASTIGPIDIIIDDGSHFSNHQILTFKKLFPHMNEGGVYLVEDTHSSYMDTFGGNRHYSETFINWCKGIVDTLHEDHDKTAPENGWKDRDFPELYRHIDSIHFHDSVVVFDKKLRPKNEVTYVHRENYIR